LSKTVSLNHLSLVFIKGQQEGTTSLHDAISFIFHVLTPVIDLFKMIRVATSGALILMLLLSGSAQVQARRKRQRGLHKYAKFQGRQKSPEVTNALRRAFPNKGNYERPKSFYSANAEVGDQRFVEEDNNGANNADDGAADVDDANPYGDDANANATGEDDNAYDDVNYDDDGSFQADEMCSNYLFSFLEGITDAKDNCEGIQNAYIAAYCHVASDYTADDDHDDYFVNYEHFSCCESLKTHYDSYCSESEFITNAHLLLIASVLLLCEMAKSLIKSKNIHWLPEAGGCMIVGTLVGAIAHWTPNVSLDGVSFSEELFLCVLLPPIIFQAALSVNKREFRRRRMAIFMFAVVGTILSTFMTGFMVHYASLYIKSATTIPLLDSFIFGALISSIDPVAILSVLTSLKLTEEDTVFIMVFGESLLNDGVAITLFNSLIAHYNTGKVDFDEIFGTIADFLIIGFSSIAIGLICGFMALIYFWLLRKKLNAPMEVASFFLWAGIPYYICDLADLSGIVAIVTVGFFMDIYITTPKHRVQILTNGNHKGIALNSPVSSYPVAGNHYVDFGGSMPCQTDGLGFLPPNPDSSPSGKSIYSIRSIRSFKSLRTLNMRELLFREERFQLSREADKHVRFVAHLLAQLSENCIFVYLGLFLFSKNYDWEMPLLLVSIVACVASRALMVVIICSVIWYINIFRQRCGCYRPKNHSYDSFKPQVSRTAAALQDRHIQLVLVLSGLRGAVSLSLVESVPIYNAVTMEGTEYKGIMKAMTSASIIFTIFVFGGSSYYILRNLDIRSADEKLYQEYQDRLPATKTKTQEMTERKKHIRRPTPESPIRKPPQLQLQAEEDDFPEPHYSRTDSKLSDLGDEQPEFIRSNNSLA
jgi:NhaP-type Na+/H+ or K+/H+ antiporter